MKMIKKLSLTILYAASSICLAQQQKVYVYDNNNQHYQTVKKAFDKFNIPYETTNSISKTDEQLYVIFDIQSLHLEQLPKYYITYQTLDLSQRRLSQSYTDKLAHGIAVWDYSQSNINRYRSNIYNYYYMPENYEYADPVILPCFLPVKALNAYKEVLIYDNQSNTDISSHLPTLFCYSIMQNPELILELGVRGGESTKAFMKSLSLSNSKLLGIDIQSYSGQCYAASRNAAFLCMSDLDFPNYFTQSEYKSNKIDFVFIDTSHLYKHTLQEITAFVPLLSANGMLLFHDSNVTPIDGHAYHRINGTMGSGGYENTRGVTQAIKEYFSLEFNEHEYLNSTFSRNGITWHIIHYPFCNGLTVLKKIAA